MNEPRIHAPALPDNMEWFNTAAPLRLEDLRGRVVLLDFWTYCCINCMHVLPDLRYLEDKYRDGLVVIGIHSPKFPNERIGAHVQKAINRYHIRHPVAHDPSFQVWKSYAIRSWPSIIFIDPEGIVVGVLSGEGRRQQLDEMIQQHLEAAERKGTRDYTEIATRPRHELHSILSFPGKLLAAGDRLYVSNSGRNQVHELSLDGRIIRTYGSTAAGMLDGRHEEAAFNNPQGLAIHGDVLYVADTGNHAIRCINLTSGEVTTLAGSGEQGGYLAKEFRDPSAAKLNSPWDLCWVDGTLFIAMAGQHQIWQLPLIDNVLSVLSGSGREDLIDGDAERACFAQPSGICAHDGTLYIADAETSAVRMIRIAFKSTSTLVGKGLFEFGDLDGTGKDARLQHPLGIACDPARKCLWLADSYNHKIKMIDISSKVVSTLKTDRPLAEPGGISLGQDCLWVANTNAHEIVRVEIATGKVTALEVYE
jgi:thiol-disulfide isomerase/thioredoxin